MEKNIILLIALILLFTTAAPAQQEAAFKSRFRAEQLNEAPAGLIPLPQEWKWEGDYLELSGLYLAGAENLSPSLIREWKSITRFYGLSTTPDESLNILFRADDSLGPEAYQLAVSQKGIEIRASAEAGRFYALQTLRQLISEDGKSHRLPLCTISDWPAYPVRGFMIDVGRNFQSLESLKKQLDIMSQYKLNTFHWHLTDRPAWRIESKRYPQLTEAANHRPTRDPGKFYSYDDIRELIDYARQRQITIIPEIDMPGHSDSFVEAMGVRMESEEGMEILKNVLEEFFSEIPKEDCPIIHIGSDEVRIDNPEAFISRMVGICEENGRKVVVWNPGLNAADSVIRQAWQGRHLKKGDYKEIDSWNNYVNNGEPMTQVLRLFFKPIGYPSDNEVIGGILCFWPDVNLGQEADAFQQNPVYPSMLTYAWASWTADVLQVPEAYYTVLPPKDSEAFRYFFAFERILAAHKQKFFTDEPFQYFVQGDKEWKLIGPFAQHDENLLAGPPKEHYTSDGRELAWKKAAGNTLIIRDRFKQGGYYPGAEPGQTYYAITYIHSDRARKVKTWIGFETPLRANRTYTGIPGPGQWDPNGGAVWANDEPLPPPEWKNPGWRSTKTDGWGTPEEQEIPWSKEELYWTREPTEVPLIKGWNKIVARIPGTTAYQNWMFTFVPLDMEGLRFSINPEGHSTYYYQRKSHFEQLPNDKEEIIFLGDSITDGCEWSEMFGNKKIKNRGISGDVSRGVLGRMKEVLESQPDKIFLMIGVNDLARGLSAEEVVANIGLIIQHIREEAAETETYLQSLLPVNDAFGMFGGHTDKGEAILAVNRELEKMEAPGLTFINLHEAFANDEGKLRASLTNDGLHLNGNGYRLWAEQIRSFVQK